MEKGQQRKKEGCSLPIGTVRTAYVKMQEEEHIAWSIYLGKKYPIRGICPTLSFTSVKHVLYLIKTLVILGVLFFLTWSFFPKEGFGQGGFNEAPHIQ